MVYHIVPNPQDVVNVVMPVVLRDRLVQHRLHPRQPLYEIVEDALESWEELGGWTPVAPAPVDPYPTVRQGLPGVGSAYR